MKFLKSPVAVAALAIVATLLLFKTTFWPLIKRSGWGLRTAPRAVVTPVPAAAPAAPPAPQLQSSEPQPANSTTNLPAPTTPLDVPALLVRSAQWAESPRRDPFKGRFQSTNAPAYPSAMQQLTLKGIWHQTGSSLAVINDHVFSKGETILAYRIESIETDRVWVQGPNGREAVEFKALAGPGAGVPRPEAVPRELSAAASELPVTK